MQENIGAFNARAKRAMVVFLAAEAHELLELGIPRCYDGGSSIPTPKIGWMLVQS
jgi:hypothetical protein